MRVKSLNFSSGYHLDKVFHIHVLMYEEPWANRDESDIVSIKPSKKENIIFPFSSNELCSARDPKNHSKKG